MSRNLLSLLVLGVLASLACITSCSSPPSENTDNTTNPPAVTPVTPGYTLFQGNTEELLVSFEYPETWELVLDEPLGFWEGLWIYFGSNSPRKIGYLRRENSGTYISILSPESYQHPQAVYENAHDLLEYQLKYAEVRDEYKDLGSGKITLAKAKGEWVAYSVYEPDISDLQAPTEYRHMTYRHVAVDYKGRVYWLCQQVNTDLDNYEDFKPGFDHILATFKFLE